MENQQKWTCRVIEEKSHGTEVVLPDGTRIPVKWAVFGLAAGEGRTKANYAGPRGYVEESVVGCMGHIRTMGDNWHFEDEERTHMEHWAREWGLYDEPKEPYQMDGLAETIEVTIHPRARMEVFLAVHCVANAYDLEPHVGPGIVAFSVPKGVTDEMVRTDIDREIERIRTAQGVYA